MKIIPNYVSKLDFRGKLQFTSNPEQTQNTTQIQTLPDTNRDYNVRVPISYNHIEDIKLNDELSAKCYKLANGQRVVIVPKDGPTVVKSYVNTGSFNEPDNLRGISHYIEHNLFNGSEDLGDKVFFDEVNKMGASTNASTSFANTNYYIRSNLLEDTDLENKIKLHAGMLQSPKFLTEKLEKEKKIVNSEINMCLSENENLGYTQTVKNLFNVKSTSLDLVAGSTDNISALTRDDVVKYFNENYYPANIVTVITGEVEPDKTMELVSKYFNSTKTPQGERKFEKLIPIENPIRQDIISPKSESGMSSVFIGFAGPENNNTKDKIALQALVNLAGGLHNSRVSNIEKKYGTGINFSPDRLSSRPEDRSLMLVEAYVPETKTEDLIKEVYAIISSLSNVPPTDDELTAIKNKMKKSYDSVFENSSALNGTIGNALLNNNFDYVKDYNAIVDSLTSQDLVNIAKKYLDLNKAALTVVHPYGTSEEQIKDKYKLVSEKKVNISFTGLNKKTPINVDNIQTYRTHNNFEVVFNNASTNTVQYKFSLDENVYTPKKAALAEVLSDMLENAGTTNKTYNELSKTADKYGISAYLYSDDYGLNLRANFPINSTKEALEFFDDKIKNPNFNQKDFEEAVSRLKDQYGNTEVNPYDKFYQSMYKNTALQFSAKDMLESLETVTLDDVKSFYKEIFEKSQGSVVVTGPFEKHPELKNEIFNSINTYSNMKPWSNDLEKVYTPVEKTEVLTDVNRKNQADIIEGFRFKTNGNIKDDNCIALLNEILGGSPSSRLFSDLRETRHLAYSVSSHYNSIGDMGVFMLTIGTTTENQETGEKTFDNVKKSIDGFNENIKKITTEKVSQEELDSAKKRLKSELFDVLELNAGKNGMISRSKETPYGMDYINKRFENIDTITVDDIYNTARNIFNSKPIYSITGTQATLEANKEYLASLSQE
ncbi:insulinase family protein [bacterium]|nr:insulinase family protein [bacterium]